MQDLPETRASLLLRVQQAEGDAWAEFVAIYRPAIYRIARQRGWQDADAHDLSQQVLVKVSNAIHRFQPDGSRAKFRTWLLAVSRNTLVDALRRVRPDAARGGTTELARLANHVAERDVESELLIEHRRQVFRWAAAQAREAVAESTWHAFSLTAVEGLTPSQAAQRLRLSVGAVYTARSRVMQLLKQKVREYEHTAEV